MTKKTAVLWWLFAAAAAAITYLFCKVTCAPVRVQGVTRLHDTCIILAFALSFFLHALRSVVTKFWNKKISRS